MVIRYEEHQKILYEEWLSSSINYIYRSGPIVVSEQDCKAGVRAMDAEI
jgi:hypothetical protein